MTQEMEGSERYGATETDMKIEAASLALAQARTRLTLMMVVQSNQAIGQYCQRFDLLSQLTIPPTAPNSRDAKPFPFFALPSEIRNRIVHYILVPGEIRPRLTGRTLLNQMAQENWEIRTEMGLLDWKYRCKYSRHRLAKHCMRPAVSAIKHKVLRQKKPIVTNPAVQFLATCQQIYHQYHTWLYTKNAFILDPGPIRYSTRYFNNLQPHHHAMVKTLIITFDLADLTSQAFIDIDTSLRRRFGKDFPPTFTPADRVDEWVAQSTRQLVKIWFYKMGWAYGYKTLRQVEFRVQELRLVLGHDEMPRELEVGDGTGLLALLRVAIGRAERRLVEKFTGLEVGEVRKWLAGGAG